MRVRLDAAIAALPEAQRTIVLMRDVAGFATADVCNALGLSETNARVLLHRGRAKIRTALEPYLTEGARA
jgi:RNA polymerase sigma-70 factor (ECF subfamily)